MATSTTAPDYPKYYQLYKLVKLSYPYLHFSLVVSLDWIHRLQGLLERLVGHPNIVTAFVKYSLLLTVEFVVSVCVSYLFLENIHNKSLRLSQFFKQL